MKIQNYVLLFSIFVIGEAIIVSNKECSKNDECTSNSYCAEDFHCHCSPGFILREAYRSDACIPEVYESDVECSSESPCSDIGSLTCVNNKCVGCRFGRLNHNDATNSTKCVMHHNYGMPCKNYNRTTVARISYSIDCVDNVLNKTSVCRSGRCVCNDKEFYYYNKNLNMCSRYLKYGEACDVETSQCGNPEAGIIHGMKCSSETKQCECDNQTHIYQNGRCRSPLNETCINTADCYNNIMLHNKYKEVRVSCVNRKCQCASYNYENNGTCYPILRTYEGCSDEPTHPNHLQFKKQHGVICQNNYFICEDPITQFCNGDTQRCEIIHGGSCDPTETEMNCIENASCVQINTTATASGLECRCSNGMLPNAKGICELGYNANCNATYICNFPAGLKCINARCQCLNNYVKFVQEQGECLSPEGRPCGPVFSPPNMYTEFIKPQVKCQAGLTCVESILEGRKCQKVIEKKC